MGESQLQSIAAHLRTAVRKGIIEGWSTPIPGVYFIKPIDAPPQERYLPEITDYVAMLRENGIQPQPARNYGLSGGWLWPPN